MIDVIEQWERVIRRGVHRYEYPRGSFHERIPFEKAHVKLLMVPRTFVQKCGHQYVCLHAGPRRQIVVGTVRAWPVKGLLTFGHLCVYLHVLICERTPFAKPVIWNACGIFE